MTDRIISGTVNRDGTIMFGSSFSASRTAEGHYQVSFRPAFTQVNGAAVTQVYPDDGSTLDNAVVLELNATEIRIKNGDNYGTARDRAFTFIVAGVGSDSAAE